MDKGDIEFKVSLNTSPAEQQLNELGNKVRANSHIYNDIFKDVGQGFKMVGSPYQNSNNYGVPSTQVLERSVAVLSNVMERFARIVETMSAQMVNFTTVGRAYTPQSGPINMGSKVAGYLPHYYPSALSESYNSRPLGLHSPDYAINANDIFDAIIRRRKAQEASYSPIYSMASEQFARTMNPYGMYETWKNNFAFDMLGLPAPQDNVEKETYISAGGRKSKRRKKIVKDILEEEKNTEKDIEEENEEDNEKWRDKLFNIGKFLSILYLVKRVIRDISNIWKASINLSNETWQKQNAQIGGFSTDAWSAMNPSAYRDYAVTVAGIQNMGNWSPVSLQSFQAGVGQFQSILDKAFTGGGVDTNKLVAIEQLHRMYGTTLTADMLFGKDLGGMSSTQIFFDFMDKFEKNPNVYKNARPAEQAQIRQYIQEVLGKEVADAIVANINKGNIETIHEILQSAGSSAIHGADFTEKNEAIAKSMRDLQSAFSDLKITIIEDFGNSIKGFTDWLTIFVNKLPTFWSKGSGGVASVLTGQTKEEQKTKATASELIELSQGSAEDQLNAIMAKDKNIWTVAGTETKDRQMAINEFLKGVSGEMEMNPNNPIYKKIKESGLDLRTWVISQGLKDTPLGKFILANKYKLSEKKYKKMKDAASFDMETNLPTYSELYKSIWGEGGERDFSGTDRAGYLFNPSVYAIETIVEALREEVKDYNNRNMGKDLGYRNWSIREDEEHHKIYLEAEITATQDGKPVATTRKMLTVDDTR